MGACPSANDQDYMPEMRLAMLGVYIYIHTYVLLASDDIYLCLYMVETKICNFILTLGLNTEIRFRVIISF